MTDLLIAISPSDPLWIAIAFLCGFALTQIGLPPLIGFLFAGFVLHALDADGGEFLGAMADLGITLLLFSIGLKLKLSELAKPQVWGVASLHMMISTLVIAASLSLFALLGIALFTQLTLQTALLVGFVLSFSSTVFAIKILDEMGASNSKHGKIAVGVLVVQDIAAVVFLAISAGKMPSLWAVALLGLFLVKPLLHKILEKTGHGELLVLFGIAVALGGADIFELVGIKGDVGALIFGMLLADHAKANELSKALLSFKELFLIGFFLSVGMTVLPTWSDLLVALLLLTLLPLKVFIYFWLFNRFYLRTSTAWRTSMNLANYSEFGLIIGALVAASGALSQSWLSVFAIVLSLSFIIAAPLINIRDNLYQQWRHKLKWFERHQRLEDEEDLDFAHIRVVIFGMGRMGVAAYNSMAVEFQQQIVGVEIDFEKTKKHVAEARYVVRGDATNPDFWQRATGLLDDLEWVLLTLPTHQANVTAVNRLKQMGYKGKIAATSKFVDEEQELKSLGVDLTFNIYSEAGLGFADSLHTLPQTALARE